jgi:hypothetical protein
LRFPDRATEHGHQYRQDQFGYEFHINSWGWD